MDKQLPNGWLECFTQEMGYFRLAECACCQALLGVIERTRALVRNWENATIAAHHEGLPHNDEERWRSWRMGCAERPAWRCTGVCAANWKTC